MNILSIQSSVVWGHVGNSAATFPLQRLGAEVWPIDTVQFSNHPGHGGFTGEAASPATIDALVDGIAARGVLAGLDAVLSGYVGDPGTAEAILRAAARAREANPDLLYACDPVIGDEGPGVYVRPGIEAHFRDRAVRQADILTPNQFELGLLTGQPDPIAAAQALRAGMRTGGPRVVLVTSLRDAATPSDAIDLLAVSEAGGYRLRTPRLPVAVNGSGDLTAALFLFHWWRTRDAAAALGQAASAVFGVIERTWQAGGRELRLVEAQAELVAPTRMFVAEPC